MVPSMPEVEVKANGERIRQLRQERGMKLAGLAAVITSAARGADPSHPGVTTKHLNNVEAERKGASVELLNLIAAALKVPFAEITKKDAA